MRSEPHVSKQSAQSAASRVLPCTKITGRSEVLHFPAPPPNPPIGKPHCASGIGAIAAGGKPLAKFDGARGGTLYPSSVLCANDGTADTIVKPSEIRMPRKCLPVIVFR